MSSPEDPLRRMLEQQQRMNEILSGGPTARIFEQQRGMNEILSGGPLAAILEQQRRMNEIFSVRRNPSPRANLRAQGPPPPPPTTSHNLIGAIGSVRVERLRSRIFREIIWMISPARR
jgi:hypothetical protein